MHPTDATSSDGRYTVETLDDPRMDERLVPELCLRDTVTGEMLFRLGNTWLAQPARFSEQGVRLELMHRGRPVTVQVWFATRACQCEPHDDGRPLSELSAYLQNLHVPAPVFTTWREIAKEVFWLLGMAAFFAMFVWIVAAGKARPRDWWWIALGLVIGGGGLWACVWHVKDLLRRPRR